MSKAFTRESDDAPETPVLRPVSVLPPGAKNLLTPAGGLRLRKELDELVEQEESVREAGGLDEEEVKRRLQVLAQRVLQIQQTLETAVVTGPPAQPDDLVCFGATVAVRDRGGEEDSYRIVGVDETDLDQNRGHCHAASDHDLKRDVHNGHRRMIGFGPLLQPFHYGLRVVKCQETETVGNLQA